MVGKKEDRPNGFVQKAIDPKHKAIQITLSENQFYLPLTGCIFTRAAGLLWSAAMSSYIYFSEWLFCLTVDRVFW